MGQLLVLHRLAAPVRAHLAPSHSGRHANGHHFAFNVDPDAYSAAISAWWAEKVAQHP